MYGSIAGSSSSAKSTTMVAACAVVAVAGLVGFGYGSQQTGLYSTAAVRPVVHASIPVASSSSNYARAAAPQVAAASASSAGVVQMPEFVSASQATSVWPIALGMTAMAAVFSIVMRKKSDVMATEPIAMLAASGERLVWFPGAKAPAHLTGQHPGDRGFDPLGLSKDPKTAERMRISEVFHGRLAMLGVVGCLFPELLLHKAAWFDVASIDINRAGVIALQCIAPVEYWRGNGGFSWNGNEMKDRSYPGFDPLELTTEDTKVREIKNGRLAMLAMLGFFVQYQTTGQSPLANLSAHLADPLHVNIAAGSSVAMFAASGEKQERPLWFPGTYAPAYLTGEYPGDRGFDVFGLAADKATYARMRASEVLHGRLAMLAIVGSVGQELLGLGAWYEVPAAGHIGVNQVAGFVLAFGLPEFIRGNGGWAKEKSYPGFDPLNLTNDYRKEAEIKNGRLAMTAMAGLLIQHLLTPKSPLGNFLDHWYHPLGNNIAANLINPPVAMFATTGHKDGLWFPNTKAPAHLTGEYPADRGFDPLGLSVDPTVYSRMRIAEVFHGRLAMLGVAGCLLPELLGKGAWFAPGDVDATRLGFIAMAIAAPTEYWRGNGGFGWEKGTTDRSYPGFDPLNLTNNRNKVAEIKNGRLAMAAIAGFAVQYQVTGQSPLANLAAHIADPIGTNITTSLAMFATSGEKGRGLWFPNAVAPSYLTGEYPADRGFDPFGLAADPKTYERMRVSEVFHGRLAMLGLVGCIFPEIIGNGAWYEASVDINRFGVIALQVIAPLEYWRGNGGFGWNGENESRDRSYPGFDPLYITDEGTKTGEIKNGRLAMVGLVGFAIQHAVTGQSPLQNLYAHLADPVSNNIVASLMNPPTVAML